MEEFKKKTKLTFSTKFFYGYGSSAFGIKNNGFSYFVLFVYSSVLGLPAWMGGLALNLVLKRGSKCNTEKERKKKT